MIKFDDLRMTRSQLVAAINENVIGKNAERNRKLLIQHFADGFTYEKLAEKFEMSPRQVGNIIRKNETKIFMNM